MVYVGRQRQALAQKKRTKTLIVRKCIMDDDTILRDAIADAERQVKKKKRQVFEPVKRQPTKLVKPKKTTKKKLTTLELFRKKKQLGKNTEAQNLLRKPTKDRDKPHLLTAQKDVIHQADLLFLPKDTQMVIVEGKRKQITYRYALVVVDTATSKTDAVPLATKKATEVLQGLKTIYNRPKKKRILDRPSVMMQVDSGNEFMGVVKRYFDDNKVVVKYGKPGRSRQQSFAESHNYLLGRMIMERQVGEELNVGQTSKEWVKDLPDFVDIINDPEATVVREPIGMDEKRKYKAPVCKKDSCDLIPVGTKVRVIADKPIDPVTGQRLPGNFRSGDLRWERTVRTVTQQILKPGNPPLYRVGGPPQTSAKGQSKFDMKGVAYTKGQLQVVSDEQKTPESTQRKWVVDKLMLEKKIMNNPEYGRVVHVLVKYKGHPPEWQPKKMLQADVPDKVKQWDREMKKGK